MSATIIQLPTAAAAPVAQPRPRRGRYPKKVVLMKSFALNREVDDAWRQRDGEIRQEKATRLLNVEGELIWQKYYAGRSPERLDGVVASVKLARLMRSSYVQKLLNCSDENFKQFEYVAERWERLRREKR